MNENTPRESGGAGDGGPELAESADQAYFRAVEELFVALRGAPMLLSPTDWKVASAWRRRGIPLAVVRDALVEVFAKRREREATGRVNSLRYCAPAVEKAWRERLELGLGAGSASVAAPASPSVAEILERLAAGLPGSLPGAERWRRRVREAAGDPEETERRLVALDAELLREVEALLSPAERDAMEEAARAAAAKLGKRIGEHEVERAARRLLELRLRERWGVPVLSLFTGSSAG